MPIFFKDVVLGLGPALQSMWAVQIGLYGFKEENMKLGGWGRRDVGGSGMSWGGECSHNKFCEILKELTKASLTKLYYVYYHHLSALNSWRLMVTSGIWLMPP